MADFFGRLFRGQEKPAGRKKSISPEEILAQIEVHLLTVGGLPSTRARRKTIEQLKELKQKIRTNQGHIADAKQFTRLTKLPIRPNMPTEQLPLFEMSLRTGWNVSSAHAHTAIGKAAREARKVIVNSRLKSLQARQRAQRGK
jgi:hypothetical protein